MTDMGMTALGLSAGWEAGSGRLAPGEDLEPMCGLGGLPPWGGPALLSGNGVKPQERGDHQQEACLCWEGSKPVLQRQGGRSPGIQDSEPSPGPGGQPGGPPSPPSLHTG